MSAHARTLRAFSSFQQPQKPVNQGVLKTYNFSDEAKRNGILTGYSQSNSF